MQGGYSLATLRAAVRHYSELDEDRLHADGERILKPPHLSATESAAPGTIFESLSPDTPLPAPVAPPAVATCR
ncbi:MAG: hypothetical protein NDI91_07080 [Sulfuritalea sp.]|nr:hypothetical protein [Sulfuritalea sp.]